MFRRKEVRDFFSRVAGKHSEHCQSRNQLTFFGDALHLAFPDHYEYYWQTLEKVCERLDEIEPSAEHIPFSSFTLNVGQNSCCKLHVDGSNLAGGICLVSPYGSYDWRKGGHLILHELKVILALPPGSFVLFPSALISHENIPIAPTEDRRVFTAFSPARLFQWVENGFGPVLELLECERSLLGRVEWARQKARFPYRSPRSGQL